MLFAFMAVDAYSRVDRVQEADVIIVLGAGLRPNNTPGPALTRRSTRAAELWREGYAPYVLCAGGKPGNRTRSEADACREILEQQGVLASAILLEETSRSTEENAIQTKALMIERGWETAVIVSDGYHLFRASRIFAAQDMTIYTSPPADNPRPLEYFTFMLRELVAINWQVFKQTFNLDVTYVQGI